MAEGDAHVYNNFKEQLLIKAISCTADVFKVALYSGTYAASELDANPVYSASGEITPSGYVAGGRVASGTSVTQGDGGITGSATWDGYDCLWPSLGASFIRKAIMYDDTTASKWLLIVWEIATDANGGNYTLSFSAQGIAVLS